MLDLSGLDVGSEGLIGSKRGDSVLESGCEGELDSNVIELVLRSKNRDVIAASREVAALDLVKARGISLTDEILEIVKALAVSGTTILVDEGSDHVLIAVGVKLDDEIDSSEILRNVDEIVDVATVGNASIDRDTRSKLSVRDIRDGGLNGVSSVEGGSKASLDSDKVIIIGPLASGDDDGLVAVAQDVGTGMVIKATISSNSSAVDVEIEGITDVVVLLEEVAVLDVGDLEDEIVVGDGLGSNLVVGVLVGDVPLRHNIRDGLSRNERLDERGLVNGGSESVSDKLIS